MDFLSAFSGVTFLVSGTLEKKLVKGTSTGPDGGRLVLNQGPRPHEVTSLAKADVDLEHRRMYIRKGKSRAARRKLDLTAESRANPR